MASLFIFACGLTLFEVIGPGYPKYVSDFEQAFNPDGLKNLESYKNIIPYLYGFEIIISVIGMVVNASLLFGIIKSRPYFVLAWLVIAMIGLAIFTGLAILGFFGFAYYENGLEVCTYLAIVLQLLALWFYFWGGVRSFYLESNRAGNNEFSLMER